MDYVEAACRGLIAAVFLVAVVGKLRSGAAYRAFVRSLDDVAFLPRAARSAAAAAVVGVEAASVVLLAIPATGGAGFALSGALLAGFAGAVGVSLRAGRAVSCQCFGADGGRMGWSHVVRNALLALVASLGLAAAAAGPATASAAGLLVAAVGGAVLGAVVTRWDDLRYLLS